MATKEEQIDTGRDASRTDLSLAAGLACCRLSSSLGHADLLGARAALLTTQPPPRGDQWRWWSSFPGQRCWVSFFVNRGRHALVFAGHTDLALASPDPEGLQTVWTANTTAATPVVLHLPSPDTFLYTLFHPTHPHLPPATPLSAPSDSTHCLPTLPANWSSGREGKEGRVGSSHKYRHWTPYRFDQSGKKSKDERKE